MGGHSYSTLSVCLFCLFYLLLNHSSLGCLAHKRWHTIDPTWPPCSSPVSHYTTDRWWSALLYIYILTGLYTCLCWCPHLFVRTPSCWKLCWLLGLPPSPCVGSACSHYLSVAFFMTVLCMGARGTNLFFYNVNDI